MGSQLLDFKTIWNYEQDANLDFQEQLLKLGLQEKVKNQKCDLHSFHQLYHTQLLSNFQQLKALILLYIRGSLEIHEISIKSAVSLTLLGIFSTGIASVIWFKVIALKGPVFLALVNYLIPVWALILGIFLLNERINFVVGFGLIFITIGIWLIEKRTK